MERYEKYKDSRVQWLGKIPGHWDMMQNRFLMLENVRSPHPEDIPLSLSQVDGLIPTDIMKESSLKTSSYDNWKRVHVDDIVLNRFKAHLGVLFVSKYVGMVSFHYGVYEKLRELVPKYYEYLFHSDQYRLILGFASKGMTIGLQNLGNSDFYNLKSIYPPLPEQQVIVAYLDDKCAKLDRLVENKKKEIELLKEMKQRVIADAVTRGLDPDVKFKETGVFWQTKMPEHWTVRKLGHILQKLDRPRPENAELLICTNKGKVILRGDSKSGLVSETEDIYQGVSCGDLLIHGMDTWHGAIAVSENDGMCTPVVHVCTSVENVTFVAFYMQSMARNKVFKLISNGVRQNTSDFRSWNKVKPIPIPLPPLEEQRAIVSYITSRIDKIDSLASKLQQEIESIKEYKQRLISDVVTGQIKVC